MRNVSFGTIVYKLMSILGNLDNVQCWTLGNTDSWNSMFVEKMCNKLEERASERDRESVGS